MAFAILPDEHEQPPPLAEFLAHAYTRRRGAALIVMMSLASALGLAALLPDHYRAMASLAILPSPEFTVREDAGSHATNNTALAMDQIMKAETGILESDDLHERTMEDLAKHAGKDEKNPGAEAALDGIAVLYPDLMPDPGGHWLGRFASAAAEFILRPWRGVTPHGAGAIEFSALRRFASHLRVLPSKDSNVIDVSFEHKDALRSAQALNAMLARYAVRRERIYNDPQSAVAEREAELGARAVKDADLALSKFKAQNNLFDLPSERDLLLKRRSQAAQALSDAGSAFAQSEARQMALKGQIRSLPVNNDFFQEMDTDTRLQTLDDSLIDLRGRLAAALPHYLEGSRVVTDLRQQIRNRLGERDVMMKDKMPSVRRAGRSPVLDPLVLEQARSLADMDAAKAATSAAQAEIAGLDAELRRLDAAENTLLELTRQKAATDERFTNASRASAEQRLAEAEDERRLANVRVIQPARIPQRPTWAKFMICAAGLVFGVLAAWCHLVLGYVRKSTFLTSTGLTFATKLPVLCVFEQDQTYI